MSFVKKFLSPETEREDGVSNRELALYALGLTGQNHTWNMVSWLPYFCNTVLKIDPALSGIFNGVSRLWDGINDPLVGAYIDRHRFKSGEKLRPYLKYTSPMIALFSTLMFIDYKIASPAAAMAVIFVIYLLFDTAYSFQDVAIWGMTAMVSPHSEERNRAVQWGTIGANAGGIIPGLITPIIGFRSQLPFSFSTLFTLLAVVFCAGGSFQAMLAYNAKERVPNPPQDDSIFKNLWVIKDNHILLLLLLASILSMLTPSMDSIYIYQEMTYNVFGREMTGEMLSTILGAAFGWTYTVSMFLATKTAKKIGGMKNIIIVAKIAEIFVRVSSYFIGYRSFWRLVALNAVGVISNIPGSMTGIAVKSLWGDSIDYLEWKTGKRTEGIAFSLQNFLAKFGGGISAVIRGQLLKWMEYDPELVPDRIPQGPKFQKWIWPVLQLGPILGSVLYLIPVLCIRYSEEQKARVEADLAERRALLAEGSEGENGV